MTFSIPEVDQLGWGQPLKDHLAQLNDPERGGFNIVENIEERDSRFWPNGVVDRDDYVNKTVYVIFTGTFHVWTISTDPANTRYWRELQKTITSQGWLAGAGTISGYGNEIRGIGTKFSTLNLQPGTVIKVPSITSTQTGISQTLVIEEIISDTLMKTVPNWGLFERRIGNAGVPGDITTNISLTNISANTVTFDSSITSLGFKAGDYFRCYTPNELMDYIGTITSVGTNTIEVTWITQGTAIQNQWWVYSTVTDKSYQIQSIVNNWTDGSKTIATIRANGDFTANHFLSISEDKKRSFGAFHDALGLFDLDRGEISLSIAASSTWAYNEGDAVFNYKSYKANSKILFRNFNAGFLFVSDTVGLSKDLYIYKGKIGINNVTPSEALHVVGNILATGTITPGSDRRWKENIVKIDSALSKISLLEGVTYHWKDKEVRGADRQIGLIAQDVEKAFPEAVKKDNEGYMSVNYDGLVGALVESIKELKDIIQTLNERITVLEAK